jgi:hypothetical protein
MVICEFCVHQRQSGECGLGLRIPKRMSCREFEPGLERFCSNPSDFVGTPQILQMATFFGIKGTELKKIMVMAERAK